MKHRGSGILLHVTSLPSPYGIGDMGPSAYRFADFLAETGQSLWQILPLTPVDPAMGSSPYHNVSSFAYNSLLISPEVLRDEGLLTEADLSSRPAFAEDTVDYWAVSHFKNRLFDTAFERFRAASDQHDFRRFAGENEHWLEDWVLFTALKTRFEGKAWSEWPERIRDRDPEALGTVAGEMVEFLERERFVQFMFARQWAALRRYCRERGVRIFGDLPIYVDFDGPDVWANPGMFKLDEHKRPYVVAGVPPDYYSATGQRWGNPIYDWDALKRAGYGWWIRRIEHNLKLYDFVRIDHFRGLVGYWEIPVNEATAVNGRWVEAPARDFFSRLNRRFPVLPVIAEDLGTITPDVREVMRDFEFPGMKVLLFAFGEDHPMHPYLPHTYGKNFVVYTGTHDNNTIQGWFRREARPEDRDRLFRYIGREVKQEEVHWELIRLAMMSVAEMVVVPMQDLLGLGEEARMNLPATNSGNWRWRMLPGRLTAGLGLRLKEMTVTYGRA